MTGSLRFRIGELVGVLPECGHVSIEDLELLLEDASAYGKLAGLAERCAGCAELAADVERLERAARGGRPAADRAFPAADRALRKKLGFDRRGLGGRSWLIPVLAAALLIAFGGLFVSRDRGGFDVDLRLAPLLGPVAIRGTSPAQAIAEAGRRMAAGDSRGAALVLARALADRPDDTYLLHDAGIVALRSGRTERAIEFLSRADSLQQAAPSGETRYWLALALAEEGRRPEACVLLARIESEGLERAGEAGHLRRRECASP